MRPLDLVALFIVGFGLFALHFVNWGVIARGLVDDNGLLKVEARYIVGTSMITFGVFLFCLSRDAYDLLALTVMADIAAGLGTLSARYFDQRADLLKQRRITETHEQFIEAARAADRSD